MILDETRERFLIAIAKQVDPTRIAEIHFFAPIRQGGVESGVAVIAAMAPVAETVPPVIEEPVINEVTSVEADDASGEEVSSVEPIAETSSTEVVEDEVAAVELVVEEVAPIEASEDETVDEASPIEEIPVVAEQTDEQPVAPLERHVIYTAAYRLTLKGPDRGKWETNITAEADAPIITVDLVVRGVQRRAGDTDDPTRMNGEEVRASLPKTS